MIDSPTIVNIIKKACEEYYPLLVRAIGRELKKHYPKLKQVWPDDPLILTVAGGPKRITIDRVDMHVRTRSLALELTTLEESYYEAMES